MLSQPGDLIPRGSSLEGVTAPPFASPSVAPRSLRPFTGRDALDKNKDWLVKSVEGMSLDEDATAKAFGVRDYSPKAGSLLSTAHEESSSGAAIGDNSASISKSKSQKSREEERWKEFSPAASGERPLMPVVSSSGGKTVSDSADNERAPVVFSDTDMLDRIGNRDIDALGGPNRNNDLVRAVLNPVNPNDVLGVLKRDSANRANAAPRDEFRALLGLEKKGLSGTTRGLMGGAGDVVNTQPDMTRQEINPVAPPPATGVKTAGMPSFSANPALEAAQNQFRPPVLEGISSRAFAPSVVESSLAPVTDLRKRSISPTILPVPKRSF